MPSKRPSMSSGTHWMVKVHPVQPGNMGTARSSWKSMRTVDGTTIYGFDRFIYQYISDEYPGEIQYDIDKIKLWSLDIETSSENGFPKPEEAGRGPADHTEELQDQDVSSPLVLVLTHPNVMMWSMSTVKREDSAVVTFIAWWQDVEPEVVTGWNVELFDIPYLCNRIL